MAMTSSKQMLSILRSEEATAEKLLAILLDERDGLMTSDIDNISEMTEQKQPLTIQLEQLSKQREAILRAEGFPIDKEGLEAFIANQADSNEQAHLTEATEALRVTGQSCYEQNQINGGIVNVNRQYLYRAMSVIQGRDTNADAYGPGGEYTNQVVRQPLLGRV